MMSMAKNPFTTLSAIDKGPLGASRNPNSKGDTQAEYMTRTIRKVSQALHKMDTSMSVKRKKQTFLW